MHRSRPDLRWIRPPRQERTQQSLERLLDVAEALLRDKDFDDIHVRDIADRSETSVAAFYRRFKDKDALLHALHERGCEEAFATADDALSADRWADSNIAEILFSVFPFLIEVLRPKESLYRAIYQRAISDEAMRERSMKVSRHLVSGLSQLLIARREEITHPDPDAAVPFSLIQVIALLLQHYTVGIRDLGPTPMSDAFIAKQLATSCLAYLGVEQPHASFEGVGP